MGRPDIKIREKEWGYVYILFISQKHADIHVSPKYIYKTEVSARKAAHRFLSKNNQLFSYDR